MSSNNIAWTRLVRYIAEGSDEQVKYGEPILLNSTDDIAKLMRTSQVKVRVCDGTDPFSAIPTNRIEIVRKLLGPLEPKDVPIVRCIGLNYKTHSMLQILPTYSNVNNILPQFSRRVVHYRHVQRYSQSRHPQ